jgi:hypothetical protein
MSFAFLNRSQLAEDVNWRVRKAINGVMSMLASQLGMELFDDKLVNICIGWLTDHVFAGGNIDIGKFHDQGDAKWIVIRRQLRGHNDTCFGWPTPGRPISLPGVGRPSGIFSYYLIVILVFNIVPLIMESTYRVNFYVDTTLLKESTFRPH